MRKSSFWCSDCKGWKEVDLNDFLDSGKARMVCGVCLTLLITLEELYQDADYFDLYQWEV